MNRQRGVSVVTALFLITGLAVLGALVVRMTMNTATIGITEWYSQAAFHAAESGIDWAAWGIENGSLACPATGPVVGLGNGASFQVSVTCSEDYGGSGRRLYTLVSVGSQQGPLGPVTRRIVVEYMPR